MSFEKNRDRKAIQISGNRRAFGLGVPPRSAYFFFVVFGAQPSPQDLGHILTALVQQPLYALEQLFPLFDRLLAAAIALVVVLSHWARSCKQLSCAKKMPPIPAKPAAFQRQR